MKRKQEDCESSALESHDSTSPSSSETNCLEASKSRRLDSTADEKETSPLEFSNSESNNSSSSAPPKKTVQLAWGSNTKDAFLGSSSGFSLNWGDASAKPSGFGGFSSGGFSGGFSALGANTSFGFSFMGKKVESTSNSAGNGSVVKEDEDGNENSNENDYDPESEVPIESDSKICDLPDDVVLKTGEEDEECLYEIRCKLYRWNQNSGKASAIEQSHHVIQSINDQQEDQKGRWVEVGVGPLRILERRIAVSTSVDESSSTESPLVSPKKNATRVVMRREDRKGGPGTRLILNVLWKSYIVVAKQGDTFIRFSCHNAASERNDLPENSDNNSFLIETFAIRTKTALEAEKLHDLLVSLLKDKL